VTEIIADSKLVHEEYIMIEDFAQYLMSKWFFKKLIAKYTSFKLLKLKQIIMWLQFSMLGTLKI
jgi:hypothetical protein